MSNRNPFTILDADFYLYLVDEQDIATDEVFIGGCAESATLDLGYTTHRLEYHGQRFARERHHDEEHTIDLRNTWLHDVSTGAARMPAGFGRNVRYVMVVIWLDDERGVWNKRTYGGVSSRGQHQEGSMQNLRWRAESMSEFASLLADGSPSTLPSLTGSVRYVTGFESMELYTYDADSAALTAVSLSALAGRAAIVASAGGLEILFDGVRALYATTAFTAAGEFVARGSTILDEVPRLEFYLNGTRVAALGASGALVTANFAERPNPHLQDFELRNTGGDWLFSLALPRSSFPSVTETPP